MCCFAQPVLSVTDTNLFARHTGKGTQFLAYQMKFSSEKPNAMILPLPVATPAKEDSVQFISLKGYDNFFKDLNRGFPNITPSNRSRSLGSVEPTDSIQKKLIVHEVGDFVASFVPTVKDFSRLDPQFVIPKESWDKVPGYGDYGFAVFQLKKLKGTTHPMAFEFKTRHKNDIFFPTVHIHDGEVHRRESFDHALYLQSETFDEVVDKYRNRHLKDKATGFVRSRKTAKTFCNIEKAKGLVLGDQLVHRLELKGKLENKDVLASIGRGPYKFSQSSLRKFWPVAPIAACLAGMTWIFHRRDKFQNESK